MTVSVTVGIVPGYHETPVYPLSPDEVIMRVRRDGVSESRKERKQVERHPGQDPVQAPWTQSGVFHTAWFKNGESLNNLQRAGYTILLLLFFGIALYLGRDAVMFAREGDFMGVIFTVIFGGSSLGFLVASLLGLRNVLRFNGAEPRK
jgi:hypothetical protein